MSYFWPTNFPFSFFSTQICTGEYKQLYYLEDVQLAKSISIFINESFEPSPTNIQISLVETLALPVINFESTLYSMMIGKNSLSTLLCNSSTILNTLIDSSMGSLITYKYIKNNFLIRYNGKRVHYIMFRAHYSWLVICLKLPSD